MADGANLEPHVQEFRFDDGGMKGLAAALCWCGLVYFVSNLDDSVVCHGGVKELAMSLLSIPTYYRRPGQDSAHAMIGRIIRQNVEAKKMAVSSFEWSQILGKMAKEGEKITVQEAIEIYNGNPEVVSHGGSGGSKDPKGQKDENIGNSISRSFWQKKRLKHILLEQIKQLQKRSLVF